MGLLKLLGLNFFFVNFPLLPLDLPSFSMTISVQHTQLPILFCMPEPNMWKSTTILSGNVFFNALSVQFTPSDDQLADCITKPLSTQSFITLCSKLTVFSRPMSLSGDVKPKYVLSQVIFFSLVLQLHVYSWLGCVSSACI